MPKIKYQDFNFRPASLALIHEVNIIIAYYNTLGLDLTLRQVYYKLVTENIIPNTQRSYDNLGTLVSNARLAGLVDWLSIVDRTRNVEAPSTWADPQAILDVVAKQFNIDMWENQPNRIEVWVEKDALKGVVAQVCDENDVPYFSCRGYTSSSEMWIGAQRLQRHRRNGQKPLILHLGDHDPSGKDMTRDVTDRLTLFMGGVPVDRLALNYDQIEQYQPPENPAKLTDSRAEKYIEEFGYSSWELDALDPLVMQALIREAILKVKDPDLWDVKVEERDAHKADLANTAQHWDHISENVLPNL